MIQRSARGVAAVATLGNLLQGWDSATVAGALLYIKPEFGLEDQPIIYGFIVAISLIGATISTAMAGPGADWLGRRFILCISATLFFIGALIMLWSPNVYILLLGRLVDGLGIGLAVTVTPMFISETAPAEIRGELNTFPQFAGSGGMFMAYCTVFGISLTSNPPWRLMLGILLIPSLLFLASGIFYLPESPRWLVSKGRMLEAKQVLQELRNREDVAGEMALLVEGLGVGGDTSLEEYILELVQDEKDYENIPEEMGQIKLFGPDEGLAYIARPLSSFAGSQSYLSRRGSMELPPLTPRRTSISLMDPMVTLIGSLRTSTFDHLPELGSLRSIHPEDDGKNDHWDEESTQRSPLGLPNEYNTDEDEEGMVGQLDDDLTSPLLSRQASAQQWDLPGFPRGESTYSMGNSISRVNSHDVKGGFMPPLTPRSGTNLVKHGSFTESLGSMGIGGGWQLAWRWTGPEGAEEGKPGEAGGFKRVYLLQEGAGEQSRMGSTATLPRLGSLLGDVESVQAAALVSQPAQYGREILKEHPVGPAMVHPSETATKGPAWGELFEGGVRRALIVGVTLQLLEQFAGINAVLYFTPQILEESGAEVLLSNAGLSSNSASLLASAMVTLMMLPAIIVAMRLMDTKGRRQILLTTIPILVLALVALVIINVVPSNTVVFAIVSVISVLLYACFFVMGFGPIPNIICAEIFPTRVRGVCTAICQGVMWLANIVITELFPVFDDKFGIAVAFAIFGVVCVISWVFVFLKVPETKGMPLEVIVEFFAMSANEAKPLQDHASEKNQHDDEKKLEGPAV